MLSGDGCGKTIAGLLNNILFLAQKETNYNQLQIRINKLTN